MKQIIYNRFGPPEVLQVIDTPKPEPRAGEVRIRVQFAGVNFSEIMARMNLYPGAPMPPAALGSEASGVVEMEGPGASGFSIGQKVMTFCHHCSYSTHVIVPVKNVIPLPDTFSFQQGAAFPVIYTTAWLMLIEMGCLRQGRTVIIHGAGGGMGTAMIQLARVVGARIIGTASSWKHNRLYQLGVDECIDYNRDNVYERVMDFTKGQGADLIIDPLGGQSWKISYNMLSKMGRLIVYGDQKLVNGRKRNLIKLMKELWTTPAYKPYQLIAHNRSIMGFHLGRLNGYEHRIRSAVTKLLKLADTGAIEPIVDRIFPYTEAPEAHQYIQDRKNFGKILLDFRDHSPPAMP